MAELFQENWILFLIALVIGIAIAWWIFVASRKTRVEIDRDRTEEDAPARRNQALIDAPPAAAAGAAEIPPATPAGMAGAGEAVAAAADPAPEPKPTDQPVAKPAPAPAAPAQAAGGDDLTRIKGVGPKLAAQLRELGVTSFAQIAAWDEADIDRVDAQLGRFQGRIRRDAWPQQARFLADGDTAGFEAKFGKV